MNYARFFLLGFIFVFAANHHAATITVANINNNGAGSLRQAIIDANSNNEDDIIMFDSAVFSTPQTIVLTTGELVIGPDNSTGSTKTLTINGTGANMLTLDGNHHSRIFRIAQFSRATISGVRVINGNGTRNGVVPDINASGGGIQVDGGYLGEFVFNLILTNSIVENNETTVGVSSGGGVFLFGFGMIINCAIVNNLSSTYSGGIGMVNSNLTLINSTVSRNVGRLEGAMNLNGSYLFLTNSTVAFNRATDPNSQSGGIAAQDQQFSFSRLISRNSIISNNSAGTAHGNDVNGRMYSRGHNILGNDTGTVIFDDLTGNQINVDPRLDRALSTNGGVIPNHALRVNSTAIDSGDNCILGSGGCLAAPLTTDQRGVVRPQDADGNGTATVDIGSFEVTRQEVLNAPGAAPDLQAASDTGASNSDNITSSLNLVFDLAGITNGASVDLLRDGVVVANITAASSSVVLTDNGVTVDGSYLYTARQTISGQTSLQSADVLVTRDTIGSTVTINQATTQADPTNTQPIVFAINFSESTTQFDAGDISLQNSTANVSSANIAIFGSGSSYLITVGNITGNGTVVATVVPNAIQDLAGNGSSASTSTDNSVTLDTIAPTVTLNQAATQLDPTRLLPVNFAVVFSEPVTGFTGTDVSLTGSTANVSTASIVVSGSGAVYNVAVSNFSTNGGTIQARVVAGGAADAAGNLNSASTSTDNIVTVDNVSPSVTINQAAGQIDPTSVLPINYTVVFSEPVTGFDSADILFTGSSIGTAGATINITGSGSNYNVAIGGNITSNGGFLRASVRSAAAVDALGNTSFASTSTDNTVSIDNVAPSVTINQAVGQADPTSVQPINFTVAFSELVTGFDASDVSLTGSTANVSTAIITVSGSGNIYTVRVSNITSSGQVRASIAAGAAADGVGNVSLASTSSDNTITVTVASRGNLFDFDGDRKTDISIFRPTGGEWWYLRSSDNSNRAFQFGVSTDKIVPADYTGDGKTDVAFWRESTGDWFILRSEDSSFYSFPFGAAGDKPVPADFDGDGKDDPAIYRPASSTWFILNSSGGTTIRQFGSSGDVPVVGDYDGDSKADLAIYRSALGQWWINRSSNQETFVYNFGTVSDKPVQADYTGDAKTDVAFFRPASGEWFVLRSEDLSFYSYPFGQSGDIPVPGDYDGDGRADSGVFRNSNTTWYLQRSTAGSIAVGFGASGDRPVPAAFVP